MDSVLALLLASGADFRCFVDEVSRNVIELRAEPRDDEDESPYLVSFVFTLRAVEDSAIQSMQVFVDAVQ